MDSIEKSLVLMVIIMLLGLFGSIFVSAEMKESCIQNGMQKNYSASDIQAICKF